jgi:hypothetical protein
MACCALLHAYEKELSSMSNRYQPYRNRGGIRFFPHIIPIAFPLIFPLGVGLVLWLLHGLFTIIGFLLLAALVVFIFRALTLGSTDAAWKSMKNSGNQWQQRFNSRSQQQQQPPYYQPQQPYYQPPTQAGEGQQPYQTYGQGYQPEQPQTQDPEQIPPMQQ